jgi:hypothetical protein
VLLGAIAGRNACAEPFIAPGRTELRVDLQTLADAGVIEAPVTTWPISWQAVIGSVDVARVGDLTPDARMALERIRAEMRIAETTHRVKPYVRLGGITEPIALRGFADTPRDEGEIGGGFSITGDRLTLNLSLTRAVNGEDDWRRDGSYVGLAIKNWAFVAGYPERWWGPGMQGSLILSTNARPVPQIAMERISARPFNVRWLNWLGPWTVSSFFGQLDDERFIEDANLFGFRMTARPLPQLEVAFSRTAQICGEGRPCGLEEFGDMLVGKDNVGINTDAENEPGNQLAGFDGRWAFTDKSFALYWQWIGEDSRQGGPQIGSWLRLFGAELHGSMGNGGWQHRTFLEIADTTCQEGGAGFAGAKYNCAYQHTTYQTGYRYEGLPLGYPTDTDSESLSAISVLSSPGGATWELGAHSVRVNQGPLSGQPHSLSMNPASLYGGYAAYVRDLSLGRVRIRLGVDEIRDQITGVTDNEPSLAFEWMVGYW